MAGPDTDADELLSSGHRDYVAHEFSGSLDKHFSRTSRKVEANRKRDGAAVDDKELIKRSAVLLPLCRVGDQVGILFTKRSGALRSHAGQVSFPGGRCDGEETVIETALRETEEEIGLGSGDVHVWTVMPSVPGRNKTDLVTPVVAQIDLPSKAVISENGALTGLKISRTEVDSVFVKKVAELHNKDTCRFTQFRIGGGGGGSGAGYSLPLYKTEPYAVWGLTAIITFQFLNVFLRKSSLGSFKHKLHYQSPLKLGNSIDKAIFGGSADKIS